MYVYIYVRKKSFFSERYEMIWNASHSYLVNKIIRKASPPAALTSGITIH